MVSMYNHKRTLIAALAHAGWSLGAIVKAVGYGSKGSLGYYMHRQGLRQSHQARSHYTGQRYTIDMLANSGLRTPCIARVLKSKGYLATPQGVAWYLMTRNQFDPYNR